MKKRFLTALMVCMLVCACLFAFAACDDESNTTTPPANNESNEQNGNNDQNNDQSNDPNPDAGNETTDPCTNGHTEVIDAGKEATCTEKGLTEGKHCSVCNAVLVAQTEIAANGHTEVTDAGKEATCTEKGLTEGKHCSVCNAVLVSQTEIAAKGHSYGEWVTTKQPTEIEKGEKRRDCANCDHFETDMVAELAHDHSKWEQITLNAVEPTCTATGLTEGKKCSGCGDVLVAQETIPAKGHTEVTDAGKAATCTETGLTDGKHCSVCSAVLVKQTVIPANGHTYGDWIETLAPSCTAKGSERRDCNNCDHYETRAIKANGHTNKDAVVENKIDATCTENGSYDSVIYCSVCNNEVSRERKTIVSGGHQYNAIVTPPTSKEQGYTTHTCAVCSDSYVDSYVSATGSIGLAYEKNSDGITCTITGLGTCTDTDVVIPETIDGYKVTAIGEKAFADCTTLTFIKIPETVKSIGTRAFYGCTGLTEITIPSSVTRIGTQPFYKCDNLKTVYYNASYGSQENPFLNEQSIETVVFGGTKVPACVAYDHDFLKTVIIGDSVTRIDTRAFKSCSNLTDLTIGQNVTSMGDDAFYNCELLKKIYFNATAMQDLSSNHYAFNYAGESGTGIKVTIGANVTRIPANLFSSGYDSEYYRAPGVKIISVEFEQGSVCTSINHGAFFKCSSLTSITLPARLTSIGQNAFLDCSSLTSIAIPDSVTSIGQCAFLGCGHLADVYMTYGETWIRIARSNSYLNYRATFHLMDINGKALTEIVIPDGQTTISPYLFANCKTLTSITIPDSVTKIGHNAFSGCCGLTNITIPDSVMSIDYSAFSGCSSLTSITVPDSVKNIGSSAFSGCTGLTSITIPDSVTSIDHHTFANCSSLASITIPNSVTSIGNFAFENCSSLKTVYYTGTASDWTSISIGSSNWDLTSATLYCYSETQPTTTGNYWHYVDGVPTKW